jgi:hypothetical protein
VRRVQNGPIPTANSPIEAGACGPNVAAAGDGEIEGGGEEREELGGIVEGALVGW